MPAPAETGGVADIRPPIRPIDLTSPRAVHVVGIGGAGMRAIARILLAMGHQVSGSDRAPSRFLDELGELGAEVFVGHDGRHLAGVEFVTRSTAVDDTNAEVVAARLAGLDVYSRAEILAAIVDAKPAILVAGTHGKTTTASMLTVILEHAGLSPSFVIGSDVAGFGYGARWTETDSFVVEADESDATFLVLRGAHAIVTSLDPDHLEFYGTPARLQRAFEAFVDSIAGTTAVCIDDPDTHSLLGRPGVVSYGTADAADLRISQVRVDRDATTFDVAWQGRPLGAVTVGLPGHHNALNAAGAITIALAMGVPFERIREGAAVFTGVARRMEVRGELMGVRFVDDYAHLPAEVEAAIAAARQGSWNRIIATYQPHRFSRTEALGATFASSFRGVDRLVLTEIYPSGEAPRPGVTGRIVLDAVLAACPDLSVRWKPSLDDVVDHLVETVGPGDLCLTLGAGDLTTVPDRVIARLRARTPSLDWLEDLAPALTGTKVLFNEPLGPRTTYRVGGAALALAEVATSHDLATLVIGAAEHGLTVLPIGKGSNLLVADRGFLGLAVSLEREFAGIEVRGTQVTMGAAVALPIAARHTVRAGLTGFEWAVGVPGSIGGAVAMNAGGHGSDMAATITEVTVMNLETGQVSRRGREALQFGYRRSSIAATEMVLGATIELEAGDRSQGEAVLDEIVRWRREHQPGGQNAGSVFTNPEGDSAGRLIDVCGCKGLRFGSAEVSEKHANFFQADPGGSADDIFVLMRTVADRVRAVTGIVLVPETRLVNFAPFYTVPPVTP